MLPLRATTCPATTAKVYLRSAVHHANKLYPRDTKEVYQLLLKARWSSAHQNSFILWRPHSSAASHTPWTCGAVPYHMATGTYSGLFVQVSAILSPHLWKLPFPTIQRTKATLWMSTMKPLHGAGFQQLASPRTCSGTSPLNLPAICFPLRKQ